MSRGLALTVALAALALVACREEAVVVGTATPTTEGATPTSGTPVPAASSTSGSARPPASATPR